MTLSPPFIYSEYQVMSSRKNVLAIMLADDTDWVFSVQELKSNLSNFFCNLLRTVNYELILGTLI